ncbi:MAG: tetratricopeptide repeat protein [Promethearchaeota archaeon]
MSIIPLSLTELESIKQDLLSNGWHLKASMNHYLRFSLKKNNLMTLVIKIPIFLKLKTEIPAEIVKFHLSITWQFWNLNASMSNFLQDLRMNLEKLREKIEIDFEFPIEEHKYAPKLIELFNNVVPEPLKEENENNFLNRFRIAMLNNDSICHEIPDEYFSVILKVIEKLGLSPSFKIPWELKKGIARFRLSDLLIFSNEETEYFLLEKDGYMTYFKDIYYQEKFYMRTFFESFLLPFFLAFHDKEEEFGRKIEILLDNCIKFCRMLLNALIKLLDSLSPNYNECVHFNPEKELLSKKFEENQNNFPFSALYYEALLQKERFTIQNDLLSIPPSNFKVMQSITFLVEAENLIEAMKFKDALNLLEKAAEIFKKHGQIKLLLSTYLLLAKTYNILKQYNISLKYLKTSFELTKIGKIPLELILKVHYKLGKLYFLLNRPEEALHHLNILTNFSEYEKQFAIPVKYLGYAYILLGIIHSRKENVAQSKLYFKKAKELGKSHTLTLVKLFQFRIKEFLKNNKISQALKYINALLTSEEINIEHPDYTDYYIDILFEFVKTYLYHRKSKKKAFQILLKLNKLLKNMKSSVKTIEFTIQWNILMGSYFKLFENDENKFQKHFLKSEQLKEKLRKIGILQLSHH